MSEVDIILASERAPPNAHLSQRGRTGQPRLVTPGEIISEDTNFMR